MVRVLVTILVGLTLLQPPGLCMCKLLAHTKAVPAPSESHTCCTNGDHDHDDGSGNSPITPRPHEPCEHEPGCPVIGMPGAYVSLENARVTIESFRNDVAVIVTVPIQATQSTCHLHAPPPLFAAIPPFLTHCALLL